MQLRLIVELPTEHYPFAENRAILIDPSGAVVQDYFKAIHPLGDANVFAPGPGVVPTTETPYGRLATVICFDADFPSLIRQAGRARTDILLVPSNDWRPVDTIHARAATFRSVENGVALVRPTGNGISVAVDHLGQPLATAKLLRDTRAHDGGRRANTRRRDDLPSDRRRPRLFLPRAARDTLRGAADHLSLPPHA